MIKEIKKLINFIIKINSKSFHKYKEIFDDNKNI